MVPLSDEPVETVTTARLRLPLISVEDAAGMLSGRRRVSWHRDYPSRADQDVASLVGEVAHGWGPRHVVRRGDGATIGCAGLIGPPQPAPDEVPEVEVVLRLVPDARGHGAGREAVGGLLGEADRLGVRVRAGVQPDDAAGMRLLARCGFTGLRGPRDDGDLVLVRPLPQGAAR